MKFIASNILCKGFALCRGSITPNDNYNYSPEDDNVDARYTQIFYLLEGNGHLKVENDIIGWYDNNIVTMNPECDSEIRNHVFNNGATCLVDLKVFKGKPFGFISGDKGASWICINPIPANKPFDCDLILGETSKTIVGDGKEHIVMCARGSIFINDKPFNIFNYARVLKGKTAEVVVPSGSEAIYLTR